MVTGGREDSITNTRPLQIQAWDGEDGWSQEMRADEYDEGCSGLIR